MIVVQNCIKFYKVDGKLLRLGEIEFFEKVMESAEELPLEEAIRMGLISDKDVSEQFVRLV